MADDEALQPEDNAQPERPDWLPDNFKSPEDLANSYRESQQKITEQGRELQELRGEFENIVESLQMQDQQASQQQGVSQQEADLINMLTRAREDGDTRAELALIAHIASLQAQAQVAPLQQQSEQPPDLDVAMRIAEQDLRTKYDDYDEYRDQAAATLNAMPGLIPDPSVSSVQRGIDTAYRLAKAEKLMAEDTSRRQAETQAERDRQSKLEAQGLTGAGARQPAPSEAADTWARIMGANTGSFSEVLREAREASK